MIGFFDDKVGSGTYAEQVSRCPGCGLWLHYDPDVGVGEVARRRAKIEIQDA